MDEKTKQALLEPLKVAIRLEQEGEKFFRDASERISSRFARQTFAFLADEEIKHIERIQEFYRSIQDNADFAALEFDEEDADRRLESFNERLSQLKDDLNPGADDIEAYEYAIKFENGAEEFYAAQLESATDPAVKKFYRWLIREEGMHARLLNSCLDFARDPSSWFRHREG